MRSLLPIRLNEDASPESVSPEWVLQPRRARVAKSHAPGVLEPLRIRRERPKAFFIAPAGAANAISEQRASRARHLGLPGRNDAAR